MRDPLRSSVATIILAAAAAAQLPMNPAGDVLVSSSSNNRILRLAFDGTELDSVSLPNLNHPRGLVVDPAGDVFVVSQFSNEVLVLDRALQVQRRFSTGSVVGPTGAAFGPNGNLFVAGFNSNNVGEFKRDGTFVQAYSDPGLRGSNCVAFRDDGHFYVASALTGSVVHFDNQGAVVRSFRGFSLSSPMGIAIWNRQLYVAGGGSSNIVVFEFDGTPVREVRHADVSGPQGVAFAPDGTFVVSSFFTHKVSWFRADGTHLRTVTPPSSQVPRSLAYLPGVTLEATGAPVLGVPFPLQVSSPFEPGLDYVAALSFANAPGIRLPDGRTMPLRNDIAFSVSLTMPGFIGSLDANGAGAFQLQLPNVPWLRGVTLYAAAATSDATLPTLVRQVSAGQSWQL